MPETFQAIGKVINDYLVYVYNDVPHNPLIWILFFIVMGVAVYSERKT